MPNITPHADGIGDWSKSDLVFAFQTSILPDGDVFGGAMAEVVEDGLSHLSKEDLEAIAEYLLAVEPLAGAPAPAPTSAGGRGLSRSCCAAMRGGSVQPEDVQESGGASRCFRRDRRPSRVLYRSAKLVETVAFC